MISEQRIHAVECAGSVGLHGEQPLPRGHAIRIANSWMSTDVARTKYPNFVIDDEHVGQCTICAPRVDKILNLKLDQSATEPRRRVVVSGK